MWQIGFSLPRYLVSLNEITQKYRYSQSLKNNSLKQNKNKIPGLNFL